MDFSFLVQWLLGLTAAANLVLGIVAYRKAPHALLNRLFLGFASNAALWTLTVLHITLINKYNTLLFFVRFSHAAAALTPWFVFALVDAFKNEKNIPSKKVLAVFVLSLLLAVLSFTPLIISGLQFPLEGKDLLYGPLFPVYALFFSGVTVYTIFELARQLRLSKGIARYQLRYFIGGILVSFVLGTLANLFLPFLGITFIDLRSYGPVFTLVMVFSICYAIMKYRLMDIRMAIRRFISFLLAAATLVGVYIALMLLLKKLNIFPESNTLPLMLFLIIMVAVFFQPLKNKTQSLVDQLFYRGAYDYYHILVDAGRAMVALLEMDELLTFLVDKVVDTIYLEQGVFFLKNNDGSFTAAAKKALAPFPPPEDTGPLSPGNPLLVYLQAKPDVLLLTDLKGAKEAEHERLSAEMKIMQAEAVVPIIMEGKLEAIFALGFKISGEPYSRDDVKLLSTLSYQIAVSLKNARLYQEMLEIRRYLENILKNMGNGLIIVDAQGKITTFNSSAEILTGIAAEKALGRRAEEVLETALYLPIMQALETGCVSSSEDLELEIHAGGRTSCLSCSIALVHPREKALRGAIMVLSDVTRIKELEREKGEARRLISLGELAAEMAHEIKNPLVSIKTFAELLPHKYDDSEFRHSFSGIVGQEIERINKLVTGLLDFSRTPKPSFQEVDIKAVVEETLALLTPQCAAQNIRLKKVIPKELPRLEGDHDQLKQALLNITINAVQAMPDGGKLGVEVFAAEEEQAGRLCQIVKILIKDTGTGISPQQKEKIFDPFFTTKTGGVGIGLSISYQIIADHGGSVKVKGRRKGTIFEINLPAACAEREEMHEAAYSGIQQRQHAQEH